MPATPSTSIIVETLLIMAGKTAVFLAPFFAVVFLCWMASRADLIVARIFPYLEWERDLGWLNIRAERRAKTALRLLGAVIYLALAVALVGIAWETRNIVDDVPGLPDWAVIGDVVIRLCVLVGCLGAWLVFLGGWLLPKIRTEREIAALRIYRAQVEGDEREKERTRRSPRHPAPFVSTYQKPRTNAAFENSLLGRHGRNFPPGQ